MYYGCLACRFRKLSKNVTRARKLASAFTPFFHGAVTINRTLDQLVLSDIEIVEWRRNDRHILTQALTTETVLQGDVLLLSGESKDIELADNRLIRGR